MNKYCGNCGHPLSDGAEFCVNCGQSVNARNETQNIATESEKEPAKENEVQSSQKEPVKENVVQSSQKEPVKENATTSTQESHATQKENANANSQTGNAEQKKSGFISMLINEVKDYLRHPQKLIPTIVLSVVWMVLPMITGFVAGANIPVVRFISTITYANGGVFGGFFGTVGGIFGKAVFAAVVNGMVLSICAKKNPFKGLKKGFVGIIGGGTKAVSPFLIGGGIGFLLYFIFNITSAPQNSAIAIVCAVSAIQAVAKQNGLLVGAVFFATKKLSKGKAPSRMFVNRILSGLVAGFSISFPLTFIRLPILFFLLGAVLLGAGIGLPYAFAALAKPQKQKA